MGAMDGEFPAGNCGLTGPGTGGRIATGGLIVWD